MSDLSRRTVSRGPRRASHNVSPHRLPGPTQGICANRRVARSYAPPPHGAAVHRTLEEGLRARIPIEHTRRGKPWKAFKPARWYPAEWEDDTHRMVVLRDGRAAAAWPADEVEIRTAADDEWEIRSEARMDVALEGQMMQIPGRVAECPEGHARSIPTRFDAEVVMLKCPACGRAYRLVSAST